MKATSLYRTRAESNRCPSLGLSCFCGLGEPDGHARLMLSPQPRVPVCLAVGSMKKLVTSWKLGLPLHGTEKTKPSRSFAYTIG